MAPRRTRPGREGPRRDPGDIRNAHHQPEQGTAFLHPVINDHSQVAHGEVYADNTATTEVAVLARAVSWFAARRVGVERVLSDDGCAYKSPASRDACTDPGMTAQETRPYCPQTKVEIERVHRTLAAEWASAPHHGSEQARRAALPTRLYTRNHPRLHYAIGGRPPVTRLSNVPG